MDLDALSAYLPADRLAALAAGTSLPEQAQGAALFADIAGFTPLTNELAGALGARRGAEELTRHLNTVYDALVQQVHRRRGSVVDFSGDAIMCWFDDGAVAGDGALRAATTALALQRAIDGVARVEIPRRAPVQLSLKVAVAAGRATRVAVGDPRSRLVDVLAGDVVEGTAAAERRARQGEVVLDPSAVRALGPRARVTWPGDHQPGDVAVLHALDGAAPESPWTDLRTIASAADWIDHRLRDRDEEEATELRATVAMFVRVPASVADGDTAQLDQHVRWVQRIVDRVDGTIVQVTMGDKGGYLYVAFGAPRTHDDLADRAITSALELRDGCDTGIGLAQGIARVGAYGGRARRTYGVLGDATNLAARLMAAAADGEILVSDHVRSSVQLPMAFDDPVPITLKGHAAPLPVSRLVGRRIGGGARRYGDLIGREHELATLARVLERVTSGPAGVVLVEGEPGVGKSHLISVARRTLAEHHEITWLTAGAEDSRRRSLGAFLPLLRDLFYQELADDDPSRRALLHHVVDARIEELRAIDDERAALLADALDDDRSYLAGTLGIAEDGSAYARHEAATRVVRVVEALDHYLRSEALVRPLVVHVPDEHDIDDDSRHLVERLVVAADEMPLCLVLDRRTDRSPLDVKPDRTLTIGPLDAHGVAAMVRTLLDGPPTEAWAGDLHRRTAGNALFVEHLVVDLHRRGRLARDDSGAWAPLPGDDEVPLTLNAALVSRLDHLSTDLRRAVQAAAVLGDVFDPDVLVLMLAGGPGGLSSADETLAAGTEAAIWSIGDDGRVRFRHALVREAAYGMQLDDHLRQQHRLAARAIERVLGPDRAAASVADHQRRAARPARAAARARRAARHARRRSALSDASASYDVALEQAAAAGCRATVLRALADEAADAAAARGDHATAVALLTDVIDTGAHACDAHHHADPATAAGWLVRRGESRQRLGDLPGAQADLEAALVALQDAPDLDLAGRIYLGLSMVHAQSGELDDAYELATMGRAFSASDDGTVRALHHLALIEHHRGDADASLAHARAALTQPSVEDDPRRRAAVRNCLGLALADLGDLDGAESAFRGAIDDFTRTGNEHGLAGALDNLAQLLARRGREDEAMSHLVRAVEILARIGMGPDGVVAAMWKAGSW